MSSKTIQIYGLAKKQLEVAFVVPDRVKDKLWFDYDIDASGIILNEIRPCFNNQKDTTKSPIFKLKNHAGLESWNIFWMPSDSKWHKLTERKTIAGVIKYIKENNECFWG